jgi:hypothetical protein
VKFRYANPMRSVGRVLRSFCAGAIAIAIVAAAVWAVETSQPFRSCAKGGQHYGGSSLQEHIADLSTLLDRRRGCLATFLHDNEGPITAIASLFVALFTFTLWRSTDRLWNAGERQLQLSRDTAQRQLRAYLGVSLKTGPEIAANVAPRIFFIVKNYGATPARYIGHWAATTLSPHPSEPNFSPHPLKEGEINLNPGAEEGINISFRELSELEARQIREDTARLYVYGELCYLDAFGERQTTAFRYMTGGQYLIDARALERCPDGNVGT